MRRFLYSFTLFSAALAPVGAQTPPTFDSTGNKLLNGVYYFREAVYIIGSSDGSLARAAAAYGNITFDGAGHYTVTNQPILDSNAGRVVNFSVTGTYSISASGFGFISSPISSTDVVYGLVSNGVFIGSSTENTLNDVFIAAPLATPQPVNSSFKGNYTLNYFTPDPTTAFMADAQFQLNPDGNGGLGDVNFSGYFAGGGSVAYTQTEKNVRYAFSNGGCAMFFPDDANANFVSGNEYLYISPDGNFVFGGSPNYYDFFVGIRTAPASSTQTLNGLYYQAGLNLDGSTLSLGYATMDTYFGSFNTSGTSSISHERFNSPFEASAIDSTFSGSVPASISNGSYTDTAAQRKYAVSADGSIRIGLGIGPFLGVTVALRAPAFTGTDVYLNPAGVINSASFAPFTTRVSGGEFVTLYGSGLAASTVVANSLPFPTSLGGVQVRVNGILAPIYYVSAGQIAVIIPYSITGSIAAIQVTNQGSQSNIVTEFIGTTSPGVFSLGANGLGYGAIEHGDGSVVTLANPAKPGETVAAFVTGLGPVSPSVTEGSAGPVSPLSQATAKLGVLVNGAAAKIEYSGLAPYLAGLYQVNFDIPASPANGDNTVEIDGPDSFSVQTLIPVSTAAATASAPPAVPSGIAGRGLRSGKPSLSRPQIASITAGAAR
jgi:uncharacterized protein (TIGR03437 family)